MSTPNSPTPPTTAGPTRVPLRLRLADDPGRNHLDGGWWPQSRDLQVELADLVDHFPADRGRIVRALFSPPDWDPAPRRIAVRGGFVKAGSFPRDDTHLIELKTSDGHLLRVLVVPPGYTHDQGEEALLAAATSGNAHSGADVLEEVTRYLDVNPLDHWRDGEMAAAGGSPQVSSGSERRSPTGPTA